MEISDDVLLKHAVEVTKKTRQVAETRTGWEFMGYVGAALISDQGNVFTGINIDLFCRIGFCAEHSATAEMVKYGETRIKQIVAVSNDGIVIPPCGRCREMILQIDDLNADTDIVINQSGEIKQLSDLLPINWRISVGLMAQIHL